MTNPVDKGLALRTLTELGWMEYHKDFIVWQAYELGITKAQIHRHTGLARSTIDRYIAKWSVDSRFACPELA